MTYTNIYCLTLTVTTESEREALITTGWWGNQIIVYNSSKCKWTGIDCNEAGRVISIQLRGYNIIIRDKLEKLKLSSFSYLQTLDLSGCRLNGSIPYQIGTLSKLTNLYLNDNYISGKLPSFLVDLTQLEAIDVSYNYLNGSIPSGISSLKNLFWLDLRHNKLTNFILDELGNLNNLSYIYLGQNQLRGMITLDLGLMTQLKELDLRYNFLTGNLPSSLLNLTQLQLLDVSHNYLTGIIPLELGNLSELINLDLGHNNLTGIIPSVLSSLSKLNYLNLGFNSLSGSLDFQEANLNELMEINVAHNSLTGFIPLFKNCNSLQNLNLSNNLLSGHIPDELEDCTSLESVSLDSNNLTGSIPNKFHCLLHLTYLNLSYNNLSDTIPPTKYPYGFGHTCDLSDKNGGLNSHRRKSVLLVLYIVLPLTIGLPLSILALVLFCQHTPKENKNRVNVKNGDMFSVWDFDGNIAYEDIITATNHFDIRYCVGTCGYGSVYEAKLPSGKTVALKKLHSQEAQVPASDRSFRNEVHMLSNVRHKNIVKLYGFCLQNRCMFLVYEFMEKESLFCALRDNSHAMELDWSRRVNIVKGVAHALSYMHHDCSPPIIHRDISSNNILLNSELEAIVPDFGASRLLDPDSSNQTMVA